MLRRVESSDDHHIHGNRERTDLSNEIIIMGAGTSAFQAPSALGYDVGHIDSWSPWESSRSSSLERFDSDLIVSTEEVAGRRRSYYIKGYVFSSPKSGPSLCADIDGIIHYDYNEEILDRESLEDVQDALDKIYYAVLCLVRNLWQWLSLKDTADSRAGRRIAHLQKSQCQ